MTKLIIWIIQNPEDTNWPPTFRWQINRGNVTVVSTICYKSVKYCKSALSTAAKKMFGYHVSLKKIHVQTRYNLDIIV